MAATKKVMFEPSIPPGKPASAAKASLPNFEEDELLDKPTILRIKRRRTDSPVDVVGTLFHSLCRHVALENRKENFSFLCFASCALEHRLTNLFCYLYRSH